MNNQDKYLDTLTDLGLKSQEAKVYLACLKLGQSTVGNIALEAEVQRTFVYDILEDLHDQGLVSWVLQRGKKYFSAVSTDQFKKLQEQKFRKFESIIPELKAIENTVGDRPKVSFYEGGAGIKLALEDTLNQPVGGEILAYATAEGFYSTEPEYMKEYLAKRAKQKIFCKAIGPDNEANREYVSHDKEQMRETRLVPKEKFPFSNEIDIYGNKIAIMSLQGELLAVIIESESVAKTQRMIFELAWLGAERYSNTMNLESVSNQKEQKKHTEQNIDIDMATAEDKGALNRMFCDLAKFNSKFIEVPEEKKTNRLDDVEIALNNKDGIVFIAKIAGKAAGYLYAYKVDNLSYAMIEHVFVSPEFREIGVGGKLIESAERWAKSINISKVELEVFDWNKEAIDFYEDEGFSEDSILMIKDIHKKNII